MFFNNIETERLFLKNISKEDRDFIFNQFSDDKVNMYLFDAEPLVDIQGADDIINDYLQSEPRHQHRWILIRKDDGAKLGTCGFHCWNFDTGVCDVGYDLKEMFWGKGYMTEAIKAIIAFSRKEMYINRINACIYPDNQRSLSLVKKLGFRFNGETKNEIFKDKEYEHKIYTLDCTAI
jgi:[ribosomal protein S5]-alanine N-acetyltransferase